MIEGDGIIQEMYKSGMTVEEIAKKEGITKKKVRDILNLEHVGKLKPEWIEWFTAEWTETVRRLRHDSI